MYTYLISYEARGQFSHVTRTVPCQYKMVKADSIEGAVQIVSEAVAHEDPGMKPYITNVYREEAIGH